MLLRCSYLIFLRPEYSLPKTRAGINKTIPLKFKTKVEIARQHWWVLLS